MSLYRAQLALLRSKAAKDCVQWLIEWRQLTQVQSKYMFCDELGE